MTIDEARAHIGDGVIWHPADSTADSTEEGTITFVSATRAFVCFGGPASHPLDPADLTLLAGE
jgi:hypothetical protein